MTDIPSFVSYGWYRVRGRGWCAAVECDQERPRDKPGLEGQPVSVDGEIFDCIGVERHMPGFPIQKGERINLLVRERVDGQTTGGGGGEIGETYLSCGHTMKGRITGPTSLNCPVCGKGYVLSPGTGGGAGSGSQGGNGQLPNP